MNQEKNDSIQCSIHNCVHHAENVDYCTLDRIHVGTHELNPTKKECTDCVGLGIGDAGGFQQILIVDDID